MTDMETSMFLYPWDLIDEGIGPVLDRMKKSGLNGITICPTYHSGMFLMPHNPKRKLVFPEPGALYFEPNRAWHGNIRIEPPISGMADNGFWNRLRKEADSRGMSITAWTIALHGTGIGTRYPDTNVVNAFGDANPAIPCAANDDVRTYMVALAGDLASRGWFDTLLFESLECMPLRHGYHHEVIGIPLTPSTEFLLSLSFSESMVKKASAAGIDVEKVRDFVRAACQAEFDRPHGAKSLTWQELREAADGEMGKFLDFRKRLLTSLLAEIHRETKGKTKLSVIDFGPVWYPMGSDGTGWESGLDLMNYAPFLDQVNPTFYFKDLGQLRAKTAEYVRMLADAGADLPLKPILRPILPQTESRAQLVAQIRELRKSVQGLSFYNYSFLSLETLEWIEEGLRT
ncbi:hypothetical protein [Cohnella candidum]|uniref:Uncharacterized protein n=1 Tax=Cohnella candidum TaxID=2674991 RepID=A0A3G3K391_9BACL|nr:hypothetical protein [Cohnella candidum]AYQ74912.1 hypothetical protein EAV92_21570 [Cohnella candidum]